jgi:PAS domain S-box-containing protein
MNKAILFTRLVAILLVMMGTAVLIGWQTSNESLTRLIESLAPMMPNTAVGFLIYGIALFTITLPKTPGSKRIILTGASIIAVLGFLTTIEYVFNFNFGIDQILYTDYANADYYPGRMSLLTAINFFIAGCCLFWDAMAWPDSKFVRQYAMLVVFFIALFALSGIVFEVVHFGWHITTMAIHTVGAWALISFAHLSLYSSGGWTSLFFEKNLAGILMRGTLLPLIILYPALAFVRIVGEKAGYYNTEGGTVFMMITSLALFVVIIIVIAQNINRLDREKDRYKKFFDLSSELLVIAKTDGYIKLASNSFTNVLGYSEKEIVSTPFINFIYPEDVPTLQFELERLKQGIPLTAFQVRLKNKKGLVRNFIWSCIPDQKTGELFAAGYDITELKEAQQIRALAEKLGIQNKQLASFAYIISHNLRAPVSNLTALLHLHKMADVEEQRDLFDKFERVSEHLSTTLNDLIESLRIREEKREREHLQFEEILHKTKEILTGQILESKAIVTCNFKKAPSIKYPRIYLESIFLNLLSNAIKYRSPDRDTRIHFETDVFDQGLMLWVEDNGLGIDLVRHKNNVFGFYKSFHHQKDSKGVGLFLTKTQVEAMGGTIFVQSDVNKGSVFKINFGPVETPDVTNSLSTLNS